MHIKPQLSRRAIGHQRRSLSSYQTNQTLEYAKNFTSRFHRPIEKYQTTHPSTAPSTHLPTPPHQPLTSQHNTPNLHPLPILPLPAHNTLPSSPQIPISELQFFPRLTTSSCRGSCKFVSSITSSRRAELLISVLILLQRRGRDGVLWIRVCGLRMLRCWEARLLGLEFLRLFFLLLEVGWSACCWVCLSVEWLLGA